MAAEEEEEGEEAGAELVSALIALEMRRMHRPSGS